MVSDGQFFLFDKIRQNLQNLLINHSILLPISGETHEEGRRGGQVWHPLWRVAPQDHQEDGDHAALQVYVLVLRQGKHIGGDLYSLTTTHCQDLPFLAWTICV